MEDPYFGEERVRTLQALRDREVAWTANTPGAVVHGRVVSADDPDAFGWDRLRDALEQEGYAQIRGATAEMILRAEHEFAGFAPKLHVWDLFHADGETLRAACAPIVARGLPEGVTIEETPEKSLASLHEMQVFLDANGMAPFSKPALSGALFPAKPLILRGPDGGVAATGFAAMTHNAQSWLSGVAWVGLIAVDPALRGLGLGRTTNALTNLVALEQLGAAGTTEFVAADNAPSRAMLTACGLRQVPDRMVAVFSTGGSRMTR